jgi:uncharacterized protein YndB with AHSA1/START domain
MAPDTTASMSVTQIVNSSPDVVFAAFTDPEEIKKWHAPGPDFTVCIAEVDLRLGGRYRIGMQPLRTARNHIPSTGSIVRSAHLTVSSTPATGSHPTATRGRLS